MPKSKLKSIAGCRSEVQYFGHISLIRTPFSVIHPATESLFRARRTGEISTHLAQVWARSRQRGRRSGPALVGWCNSMCRRRCAWWLARSLNLDACRGRFRGVMRCVNWQRPPSTSPISRGPHPSHLTTTFQGKSSLSSSSSPFYSRANSLQWA
jgi:hypothetical protein